MKTVTFCGHGKIAPAVTDNVKAQLHTEIEGLIKNGATEFLLGGYGDFDYLSASAVKELKKKYPQITSTLVLPYIERSYNDALYDDSEYPPIEHVPKRFAISKRNEYMVDKADVVIAYVIYEWGGAAKTLEYAKRKKKQIIMLKNDF